MPKYTNSALDILFVANVIFRKAVSAAGREKDLDLAQEILNTQVSYGAWLEGLYRQYNKELPITQGDWKAQNIINGALQRQR